jgi:serine/threonine-protein kinase/endoribonuclease IRE1
MVTGTKSTSLLTLDLRTGKPIDCFSSRNPQQRKHMRDPAVCESDPLDDLEGRPMDSILYVGRTDYTLTITTPPEQGVQTGANKNMSVQEITYSTYTPNSYDKALAEYWARTGAENWGDGERIRVELGFNGEAIGVQEAVGHKWSGKLPSVGVAVYDVVLPLSPPSPNPVILPQPRAPEVKKLFPSLPAYHIARLEDATRPPTAYIGSIGPSLPPPATTKESDTQAEGSSEPAESVAKRPLLFAQSAAAYPIIKIAGHPPRPGKVNGTFVLSDDLTIDDLTSGDKFGTLDQMGDHTREQRLLDPPSPESMRIAPPESAEGQLVEQLRPVEDDSQSWWKVRVWELLGMTIVIGFTYHWASSKAAKKVVSATEKIIEASTLLSVPPEDDKEKKITTPVVRFEVLPEDNDPNTPPKKKQTRRRVRGKKKRRGSVGPADEAEGAESNNDEADGASPTPSDERTLTPTPKEDKLVLPRSSSSVSLNDEHERLVISDIVIGFGSHGTVVLKGTWGGRPVAVKRLLSDFVRLASQEVKLLQASDDHPNVIRCKSLALRTLLTRRLLPGAPRQLPLHCARPLPGVFGGSHRGPRTPHGAGRRAQAQEGAPTNYGRPETPTRNEDYPPRHQAAKRACLQGEGRLSAHARV